MKKHTAYLAAASAAALIAAASAARADVLVMDTELAAPGVYFGSGNFNTHYAVDTAGGVEIGLKSKIRGDATDSIAPVGDVYVIGLGNKVSFDYSVNADINGDAPVDLSDVTALLTIFNLGTGQSASFDPSSTSAQLGNTFNASTGGYQNSEQLAFFPSDGFSLNTNATYLVRLSLTNVPGVEGTMSVDNVIQYGAGGIPEPTAWALLVLGFGGAGAALRRRRGAAVAA